ncbi:MAG TPA: PHP domain-containing protein, partial [Methylomirabilota bacterium]|nr:PHP domain-containing protein [Methylomirabilota bacterium]
MYVELHARSAFSFLEAAALPEALAERAARLEQPAIALLDADGVYGAPRLYRACNRLGLSALVGAEITLADGSRLPLLVEDREGYQNLCRLLTRVKMRAPKGEGAATFEELAEFAGGLVCLTGGGRGPVAAALARAGAPAGRECLDRLVGIYGRYDVFAELQRHLSRPEEARNEWLRAEAARLGLSPLATNEPRLIARGDRPLLDVLTCIREHSTLEAAGRLLARNSEHFMKSGRVMERLFADSPEAVANTGELALRLGFTLKDLGYRFPDYPLPRGETPLGFLRALAHAGARDRYGSGPLAEKARRQIEHELALIGRLDLAGYFLIVWDLVQYCRAHDVLVQGRGSAANSAVCYALGLTAVDPVGMELLFERFLSEER